MHSREGMPIKNPAKTHQKPSKNPEKPSKNPEKPRKTQQKPKNPKIKIFKTGFLPTLILYIYIIHMYLMFRNFEAIYLQ